MTTAMIEIRLFNDKTNTETTLNPFAWVGWPAIILASAWGHIMIASAIMLGKRETEMKVTYPKRTVIHPTNAPASETDREKWQRIHRASEVTEWRGLPPVLSHRIYESRTEFEKARNR